MAISPACSIKPIWCDGVVARASALQSVDLGFISQVESYQKILKICIHSFPVRHLAHKATSLLVVSLIRTLHMMVPPLCGRQMAGLSSLSILVTQSN